MYRGKVVGVSVPAHNEEKLIITTLMGIPDYIDRIYVCNDASTDRTREKVEEYMGRDGRVVLINHERNMGVGGAVVDCHKLALREGMEIIAVMAGDDQMDPSYLPRLLDPLVDDNADYTKGNRLGEREALRGMSRWRYTGNYILTLFSKIATGNWMVCDPQNGYTAITADALRRLPLDCLYKGYLFENDMLVKLNANNQRIVDVPIPARYKNEISGINYYSFITSGLLFLVRAFLWRLKAKYLIGCLHPPRLYRVSGILLTLLGSLVVIGLLIENLMENDPLSDGLAPPSALVGLGLALVVLGNHDNQDSQAPEGEK
jgi:glycosyltransferase involved in cell wall biosynthesis